MKKILTLVAALSLVATLAVGGSIAYLQDADQAVNVMTLGSVYIEQYEHQLADDGVTLEPFEQAKDFYPNSTISKIVTVENTGKSDAYFRTLIAFEDIDSDTFEIGFPINEEYTWSWGAPAATIEVNGVKYEVYEALYKGVLKPGETSPASLTKVDMAATATNKDMEALGGTYDILVISQAVQTVGFDDAKTALETAFGKTSEKAAEWFGGMVVPTVVSTKDELTAALTNGGSIVINEDIVLDGIVNIENPANLDLNGNTLTVSQLETKADTKISGGEIVHGKSTYPALSVSAGTLTMEDVKVTCEEPCNIVTSGTAEAAEYAALEIWAGGNCVLNNCEIFAKSKELRYSNSVFGIGIHGGELTMNGGSITVESAGSTRPQYNYEGAIFAGSAGDKTVNLNNVNIAIGEKGYKLFAWGGKTTVNTTDAQGTWSEDKIHVLNNTCTYEINYVK